MSRADDLREEIAMHRAFLAVYRPGDDRGFAARVMMQQIQDRIAFLTTELAAENTE